MADTPDTTAFATVPIGGLIPQPNGGALQRGNPGNRGGLGATPSELRARLRGSLANRIRVAEDIADNPKASNADRLRAIEFLGRHGLNDIGEDIGGEVTLRIVRDG